MNLADFTGEYFSEELSTTYNFMLKGEELVAEHPRRRYITFEPLRTDMFFGSF